MTAEDQGEAETEAEAHTHAALEELLRRTDQRHSGAEDRRSGGLSWDEGLQWVWRMLSVVYVPILAWMLLTILDHDRNLQTINASRFTAQQGAEITLTFTQALTEMRGLISSVQSEVQASRLRVQEVVDLLEEERALRRSERNERNSGGGVP